MSNLNNKNNQQLYKIYKTLVRQKKARKKLSWPNRKSNFISEIRRLRAITSVRERKRELVSLNLNKKSNSYLWAKYKSLRKKINYKSKIYKKNKFNRIMWPTTKSIYIKGIKDIKSILTIRAMTINKEITKLPVNKRMSFIRKYKRFTMDTIHSRMLQLSNISNFSSVREINDSNKAKHLVTLMKYERTFKKFNVERNLKILRKTNKQLRDTKSFVSKNMRIHSRFDVEGIFQNLDIYFDREKITFIEMSYLNNDGSEKIYYYLLDRKGIKTIKDILDSLAGPGDNTFNTKDTKNYLRTILLRKAKGIRIRLEHIDDIPAYKQVYLKRDGNFFQYYNLLEKLNLEKYGIFNKFSERKMNENCLVTALISAGLKNDNLKAIIGQFIVGDSVPICKLIKIAPMLDIYIRLKLLKNDKKSSKIISYGDNTKKLVNLGLLDNHYFINEEIPYQKYAIKHYFEICDEESWELIRGKNQNGCYLRADKGMFSFKIIMELLKNKNTHLKQIPTIDLLNLNYVNIDKDKINVVLNNDDVDDIKEGIYNYSEPKDKFDFSIQKFTLDTEATVQGKHKAYQISINDMDESKVIVCKYGNDCVKDGLSELFKYILAKINKKNIRKKSEMELDAIVYVHNLKYDFAHLKDHIKVHRFIYNGYKIIAYKMSVYEDGKLINIQFRDSYSMITASLSKFAKMFDLDVCKDIYPYEAYNNSNINKDSMGIFDALMYIKKGDRKQFLKNLDDLNIRKGGRFDHKKYAQFYCNQDVTVLSNGLKKFNDMTIEAISLSIYPYLTSSSLGDAYMKREGVYDGCYKMKEVKQLFIQRSLVGGKCQTQSNKKFNIKDVISDFDAVSLYPSAMLRLAVDFGGYLKGTPKPFINTILSDKLYDDVNNNVRSFLSNKPNIDYEWLEKNTDGYFVEIEIIKDYPIKRKFPVLSKIYDNKRNWVNDLKGLVVVDKITLEDLVEYHGLIPNQHFWIHQGYYFNEGRNNKIGTVIKKLFDARKKYKKEGNPIQSIFKLIMNSAYGKTIQKSHEDNYKFFYDKKLPNDEINTAFNQLIRFIYTNRAYVKSFEKINDKCYMLKHSKFQSNYYFNFNHLGSEVLSMSKRIMNEVQFICDDNDINTFYQDTDSIHMLTSDITKLEEVYRGKYNRELIGKELGQFHSDFDNVLEIDGKIVKADRVDSVHMIILGKKCYYDKLRLIYNDEIYYKDHIRMKGIPDSIIKEKCKCEGRTVLGLYKNLYKGKQEEFDLAMDSMIKPSFEFINWEVKTRVKFLRKIKFI